MDSLEPKKLALIRILQIFQQYSDFDHPLKQEDIADILERDYGIVIERKAVGRNISLLKEAGIPIESKRSGSYLEERDFEDSELKLLIDSVLSSKHITAKHSKELIEKLSRLSNKYFKSHIKNVHSVNDWSKTENLALFYNIEIIDEAIATSKQIKYTYNKYGTDKKLHRTSSHAVSPYSLILHNQKYYLMGYHHGWGKIIFHRLDKITGMEITEKTATPIKSIEGYKNGIDYKELSSALPYMYTDKRERIEFLADRAIVDQIVDWFGYDVSIDEFDESRIKVRLKASPNAMFHWAMQYIEFVEITAPNHLRERIKNALENAIIKYN